METTGEVPFLRDNVSMGDIPCFAEVEHIWFRAVTHARVKFTVA